MYCVLYNYTGLVLVFGVFAYSIKDINNNKPIICFNLNKIFFVYRSTVL